MEAYLQQGAGLEAPKYWDLARLLVTNTVRNIRDLIIFRSRTQILTRYKLKSHAYDESMTLIMTTRSETIAFMPDLNGATGELVTGVKDQLVYYNLLSILVFTFLVCPVLSCVY